MDIATRARGLYPDEIKQTKVSAQQLASVLQEIDPAGHWKGGRYGIPGAGKRAYFLTLNATGSWVAQIGPHFVVVDGLNGANEVLIRDPWATPAGSGTRYRVSYRSFARMWHGLVVFSPGR